MACAVSVLVALCSVPIDAFSAHRIPLLLANKHTLSPALAIRPRSLVGRVGLRMQGTDSGLKERIATFYDQSSPLWEEMWGEHMHMGFYGEDGKAKKTDAQAQIDMVDRLLSHGGVTPSTLSAGMKVLDVGCGVGGSSRHIANKHGCSVTGITLSTVQAQHAADRSEAAGLSGLTDFQVADALDMPFGDSSFDLVWSLEVAEHFPDREKWLKECWRVLKPGGRLLVATWTHREAGEVTGGHKSNMSLEKKERKLLDKICKYYALPEWVQLRDYTTTATTLGFKEEKTDDWSAAIAPFWPAVWRSALSLRGFTGLVKTLRQGLATLLGARAVLLMIRGFKKGLIRMSAFTFVKPK